MQAKLDQIEEEAEISEQNVVKYPCNMHPITKLTIPDFMDHQKSSLIDTSCSILYAMLPMSLNFMLNYASALINIYFVGIKGSKQSFAQICFGTAITTVVIYFLIEHVGTGFSIICSYFSPKQKQQVGYLYQKTLGITFLICVFMTPAIYLTDKLFRVLDFDFKLVQFACSYAWALVPSFYLTSFIDTNKNYLLSQGIIFPPIVIHFLAVCLHLIICSFLSSNHNLGLLSSAWVKNITDCVCALSIYLFIIIKEPTKESWVEWNIKSTNNVGKFLKQVLHHQAFPLIQVASFQLLSIIVCYMDDQSIAAHNAFGWLYMLLYFFFSSLSQCVSRAVAVSIQQVDVEMCKKKISLGILLAVIFSVVITINIVHYRAHFTQIFTTNQEVTRQMESILYLFCITLIFSGLNVVLLGIVKTLQLRQTWVTFSFYFILGLLLATFLCYFQDFGLWGIWIGWLVSVILVFYQNLKRILCLDFQQTFTLIQNRYKVAREDVRVSKIQLTNQIQQANLKR